MTRDRNNAGRFDDAIPPETVLEVFDGLEDTARPLTAGDIVDELGVSRRTAHNKLNRLVERGVLETRKVGARGRVWWVPHIDGSSDGLQGDETPPRDTEPIGGEQPPAEDETPVTGARDDATDTEFPIDLRDGIPGSGSNLEGRVQAVWAIHEYLKEHGSGQRSDFKDVVDVEATGYKDFNSFYTNAVTIPGILQKLPGVQVPGEGGHTYRYVGGDDA